MLIFLSYAVGQQNTTSICCFVNNTDAGQLSSWSKNVFLIVFFWVREWRYFGDIKDNSASKSCGVTMMAWKREKVDAVKGKEKKKRRKSHSTCFYQYQPSKQTMWDGTINSTILRSQHHFATTGLNITVSLNHESKNDPLTAFFPFSCRSTLAVSRPTAI